MNLRALKATLLVPLLAASFAICHLASAGPPFVTDDPEPTDYRHFEVYGFGAGTRTAGGTGGVAGIDFNYGAAPDLQLTAALPVEYDGTGGGPSVAGVGNIELAVKYRFLHQETTGWDVSFFPRVFLPAASHDVGNRHASILLPIWVGRNWGDWSTFGGGGCAINPGPDNKNYCLVAWALTRQVLPHLQLGLEVYHQTADARDARGNTGLGIGAKYDVSENIHLLASIGPGLQHTAETNQYSWYTSLLLTF